jgi:hypothetical protein
MTLRRLRPLGLLVLALAAAGCSEGRKNPPDATVRILNVAPSYASLGYRREEITALNPPVSLAYEASSDELGYDEDTYDFHASILDAGGVTDVDSFSHTVVAGTLYTFIFMESGGGVTHTILESPRFVSDVTNARARATHAIENLPSVDLYLEAQGTDITGAAPWGTIGFKESLASRAVADGVYELTVTEAGNPAHVLFVTQPFALNAATTTTLVLCPDTGEGIAPFGVVLLNALGAIPLVDPNLQASVRALNGATDQAPRDVAFASQFTPPLFSGAAFATPTSYQPLAAGAEIALDVTPAGNPSAPEASTLVTPLGAKMYTTFFTGDAGALGVIFQQDDRRRIAGQAKITFYDAAPVSAVVEALVLKPGTDPTTIATSTAILTPGTAQEIAAVPDGYEIWLRDFITSTMLAGPVAVTLADKGLYGIFLSNDANGTTIDISLIDGFP